MAAALDIDAVSLEQCAVLTVRGEIDMSTAPLLERRIEAALRERSQLVVDLTGTGFMDSTGLRVIIAAQQRLQSENGRLALVVSEGPIMRLLRITGLDGSLAVYDSVDAATSA